LLVPSPAAALAAPGLLLIRCADPLHRPRPPAHVHALASRPTYPDMSGGWRRRRIIADTDQENCQKRGAAANRYAGMQNGPVTAGGDGPGQGVMGVCWSGSLVVCGDGDGYSECFELADVVADLLGLAGA